MPSAGWPLLSGRAGGDRLQPRERSPEVPCRNNPAAQPLNRLFPAQQRPPAPAWLALWLVAALASGTTHAVEPEVDPAEMPRVPALEVEQAARTFEIRPGFELQLVAAEPLVMDPVDLAFDERGRLFVVEMRSYPERREQRLCRIRLLTDTTGDGRMDRSVVYAEDLAWATSVVPWDGGVFVSATPDIIYLKDTTGDDVADHREVVFTGFGEGRDRLNMQALVNGLRWGPDHRIWGATAGNGGVVRRVDGNGPPVRVDRADFSFDPRTRDFRAENGTAQFGLSFDTRGRRFVCSNSNHIRWVAWERADVVDNPHMSMPAALVDIPVDGPAGPVFRISPDEPWRIVRTRWRVAGLVPGPVEGGGRVSGYFTAASGITIYTGDALGPEFVDNAFVGDVGSNLVHRKLVRDIDGRLQPVAERPDDERETEFLRSTDNWFRPVNFANGPDGALYIADMYRETIEHPWSLPDSLKQHLDLHSGSDRGRIWRVVPAGFDPPAFDLERDNHWQQRTRARLAFERGEEPPGGPASWVRQTDAVKPDREADPWARALALNRLTDAESMRDAWNGSMPEESRFRAELAGMIGRTGDDQAATAVLDGIVRAGVDPAAGGWLAALAQGRSEAGAELDRMELDPPRRQALGQWFTQAATEAADGDQTPATRLAAVGLLRYAPAETAAPVLAGVLLDAEEDDRLRTTALEVDLGRPQRAADADQALAAGLLEQWQDASPGFRAAVFDRLAPRAGAAPVLLEAVRQGRLTGDEVPVSLVERWHQHTDAEVRELALEVFPPQQPVPRAEVVEHFRPALAMEGDAARGREVYVRAACLGCHRTPDGDGAEVGPDLASFRDAGGESLLAALFDPSAEVAPRYQAFLFELDDGESILGMIDREDAREIVLRLPGGVERRFARQRVASMQGLQRSLMPEGLENVLSVEDVADLLAYIATVE